MDTNDRKLCMIPGPIEFHEDVLKAMGHTATSHVDPKFINIFGECIEMLRKVFLTKDAQPFILSGSGVMGWDAVAVNLLQPNDEALVLSTGVFGDRFVDSMEAYGAKVTTLRAPLGGSHDAKEVEEELKKKNFKMVAITQVDTSTGVLSDVKGLSKLINDTLPNALIIVDAVCAAAAEELKFDEWNIDVLLTASQKAIGVPPGLCLLMVSKNAMEYYNNRQQSVANYYLSWNKWLPIMQSYEARKPSYFATPAVQVVNALHVGLTHLLDQGMDKVFSMHVSASQSFKEEVKKMGLKLVTLNEECAAHTMTTMYYPEGVAGPDLLQAIAQRGVMVAGGLHPSMATKYFRVGHMGLSVRDPSRGHVKSTLDAIKGALDQVWYKSKA